jgi:hypothetical protein
VGQRRGDQAYLTLSEVLGHLDLLLDDGRAVEEESDGVVRACRRYGKDEVHVAELVPEVAGLQRGGVGALDEAAAGDASSMSRCEASGSCQPVSRPSTRARRGRA